MLSLSVKKKAALEAIIQAMLWVIWQYRNGIIFGESHPVKNRIFDDIVDYSYNWVSFRNIKTQASWVD